MADKHGSQSSEQNYFISSAQPTDVDVVLGKIWVDPDDGKMYRCTSLGPVVFTEMVFAEASVIDYGLSFQAIVTTATSVTEFAASGLTGKGNDFFTNYFAYVIRDDGGASAAPQGEIQPISDYVSSTGAFTHTQFTVQLAVGDEVIIIHPAIAYMFGVAGPQPPTAKSIFDILHKDGNFTFDNTTDSLEALRDLLATIPTTAMRGTDSAALASVATETRLAELDAGNLPTDIAAIPTTAMRGTDSAALASVLGALNTAAAAGAVTDADEAMAYLKQLVTMQKRAVHVMDFKCTTIMPVVTLNTSAGDKALPAVTVADLPAGAVLLRVEAWVSIGEFEDTSTAENSLVLAGTEHIQVKETSAGSFIDAIKLVAAQWLTGASARRAGNVYFGSIDIKAEVDANDGYSFQIENADVTGASLLLRDVQTGLRVYFTLE